MGTYTLSSFISMLNATRSKDLKEIAENVTEKATVHLFGELELPAYYYPVLGITVVCGICIPLSLFLLLCYILYCKGWVITDFHNPLAMVFVVYILYK